MPGISALGRRGQEDQEFKASLAYIDLIFCYGVGGLFCFFLKVELDQCHRFLWGSSSSGRVRGLCIEVLREDGSSGLTKTT